MKRTPEGKLPAPLSPGECAFALHCRAEGLNPNREYMFHPSRKWRFDFAFIDAAGGTKVAVEIEGRGRHQSFGGFEADCQKYNAAAELSWTVLRYTPSMVASGEAIDQVLRLLKAVPRARGDKPVQ